MEFASPQMGKPPDHFRANDSCWRSKCVDRSFIMLSYIWVSVGDALSSAARFWISGMAAQRCGQLFRDEMLAVKITGLVHHRSIRGPWLISKGDAPMSKETVENNRLSPCSIESSSICFRSPWSWRSRLSSPAYSAFEGNCAVQARAERFPAVPGFMEAVPQGRNRIGREFVDFPVHALHRFCHANFCHAVDSRRRSGRQSSPKSWEEALGRCLGR